MDEERKTFKFGVRHLFVFLGDYELQVGLIISNWIMFKRVSGVCQCVRDEGEPVRGDRLHGGEQQDGGQPGPGG